jgi:glycosyltransferase involved in cell wall biosynthesis
VLYRDAPLRRVALAAEPGSAERYWLFGADQLAERGFAVRHSLEPVLAPSPRQRRGSRLTTRALEALGGYGGDFATVLACRRPANAADVVLSTVDTVGIPLALLAAARVVRAPFVYVSVGLLERLDGMRSRRAGHALLRAVARAKVVVAYGHGEADALRARLAAQPSPPDVRFVPFGVDTRYFSPLTPSEPSVDVLAVGADPHRDYNLLSRVAAKLPERSFSLVVSDVHARGLRAAPANVSVETDVPFVEVRERLARTRVVALPVRDNLYTGATTSLLQAMAMAKPVVVSRTAAVGVGYGLVDGENCRLVEPGDERGFATAVADLLADGGSAARLGANARRTVEALLTWDRYVDAIADALRSAVSSARTAEQRVAPRRSRSRT